MALRDSGKEHTGGRRRSTQKRTALNNRSLPCGIEFIARAWEVGPDVVSLL